MNIFSSESLNAAIENLRQDCEKWNNGNPSSWVAEIQNKQLDCLIKMRENMLELESSEEYIESDYGIS
jgi:hypothetical protein